MTIDPREEELFMDALERTPADDHVSGDHVCGDHVNGDHFGGDHIGTAVTLVVEQSGSTIYELGASCWLSSPLVHCYLVATPPTFPAM